MTAWPFRPDTPVIPIAHRGGIGNAGENTLEAFAAAVATGYRFVETDVHLTRDGEIVAFHDADLARMTGRAGRIADLDWQDIAGMEVDGGGRIPRLDDLLETWPDLFINIDPKSDAVVDPLIALLRRRRAVGRVCIGSFSTARLRKVRAALGPELATSMGPHEIIRLRLASLGLGQVPAGVVCAQVPIRYYGVRVLDQRLISCAHEAGLKVHVWTINDRATMERLLDLGVDAIMTDDLALLKSVMQSRGLWQICADFG